MTEQSERARAVKFGAFELDLAAGELRKNGLKVRLQEQPFRLLALLVERPGELVSREELREKLWPSDTYVDFDNSLNTAASKLRDALGDSASNPRFIETLPRRGYRFLASVDGVGSTLETAATQSIAGALTSARLAPSSTVPRKALRRPGTILASLVACGLAIGAVVFWRSLPIPPAAPPLKFSLPGADHLHRPVISPDGQRVTYVAGEEHTIWIQNLNDWEPRKIEGTEQSLYPFWSPDSASIALGVSGPSSALKRVGIDGESPTVLCRLTGAFKGGAWSPDGASIVFAAGEASRLYEVSALGGDPKPLLEDQAETSVDTSLRYPHFLPLADGRRVFLCSTPARTDSWIYLVNLATGEQRRLARGGLPAYSRSGHILYQTADAISGLHALPFSPESLEVTGDPFPIGSEAWEPSVSDSGTLVYRHAAESSLELVWRNRVGEVLSEPGVAQERIRYTALSQDETRVAVSAVEGNNIDIWLHELQRGVKTRITSWPLPDLCPLWSVSGAEIVFSRSVGDSMDIFMTRADGTAEPTPLIATEWKEFASHWSADGNFILYDRAGSDARNDIWYLQRKDGTFEPHPFLESDFDQRAARFSPEGKYVAYVSNKSGDYEVYVRDFPEGRREWKASEGGGRRPHWSKDGRELFHVNRFTLFSVRVTREPEFSLGAPEALFQAIGFGGTFLPSYDVSSDGRLLVPRPASDNPESIRVVQNWFAEFKDRPGGGN